MAQCAGSCSRKCLFPSQKCCCVWWQRDESRFLVLPRWILNTPEMPKTSKPSLAKHLLVARNCHSFPGL